ncbi:hypothetical protein [Microbacterium sp. XT11]|uniref:hypothetical protein n=1 Tax=Microbacterium sp. XT11 TaxID=367477 RepID=UPI0008336D71|nr:hypothetical protein [Microbacterium sp. XT11]
MHSFTHALVSTADAAWAWAQASQEVISALAAVDSASAALTGLTADTAWESDGVRALNEKLVDIHQRAGEQAGLLAARQAEIESAAS